MRAAAGKRIKLILTLILSAQAICLCWLCASCARAEAQSSSGVMAQAPASADAQAFTAGNLVRAADPSPSGTRIGACTRAGWLRDMMLALGLIPEDVGPGQYHEIFSAAYELGIIDSPALRPYNSVTREYAASTIVRALDYEPRSLIGVWDVKEGDDLMTLVSYGYFTPDEHDMVHPEADLSEAEYAGLIDELRNYRRLNGRHILAFGDSIMYGFGNEGEGIADLMAEKYGMTVTDLSVSGATFGVCKGRSHIANQVAKAAAEDDRADIILLNGGTNDVRHTAPGEIKAGFAPDPGDQKTFASGMEYALSLIRENWPIAPVLYIRAHDMAYCDDAAEREYGELGLAIADKWSASCVDIFSDTGFNAEETLIRNKYTYYREQTGRTDSVHPNALGYAVFYLPLISQAACELI